MNNMIRIIYNVFENKIINLNELLLNEKQLMEKNKLLSF